MVNLLIPTSSHVLKIKHPPYFVACQKQETGHPTYRTAPSRPRRHLMSDNAYCHEFSVRYVGRRAKACALQYIIWPVS